MIAGLLGAAHRRLLSVMRYLHRWTLPATYARSGRTTAEQSKGPDHQSDLLLVDSTAVATVGTAATIVPPIPARLAPAEAIEPAPLRDKPDVTAGEDCPSVATLASHQMRKDNQPVPRALAGIR